MFSRAGIHEFNFNSNVELDRARTKVRNVLFAYDASRRISLFITHCIVACSQLKYDLNELRLLFFFKAACVKQQSKILSHKLQSNCYIHRYQLQFRCSHSWSS